MVLLFFILISRLYEHFVEVIDPMGGISTSYLTLPAMEVGLLKEIILTVRFYKVSTFVLIRHS
jgi:hypothetical protein